MRTDCLVYVSGRYASARGQAMIASLRCSQRLALPKADDDEEQDLNLPDLFFQVATKSVAGGRCTLRARAAAARGGGRGGPQRRARGEREKKSAGFWDLRLHVSHDIRPPKHRDQETDLIAKPTHVAKR